MTGASIGQTVAIPASPAGEAASDFAELYGLHYARVVRALELGGLARPAAEDVAQEAFARTLGHWKRVRLGTNPAGYVYTVAFRLTRRRLGRNDAVPVADPGALVGGEPGLPLQDVSGEATARAAAEAALRRMPVRRRSCAVLCLVVGLSPKEAAASLRIAEGTVRKQLEQARRALREALVDTGG